MTTLKSVVSVIKFTKLANELTTIEFDQFLVKLTNNIGKEVILKLLCSPFVKTTSINHHESLINNMMKIISNIIQSRKSKDIEQRKVAQIDELPSPLIGEISSYLPQKRYSLFSRSNRAIFVSCNTPNTLKKIELNKIKNYSSIKLQNYPQITCLSFKLSQFNQFPMNEKFVSNRDRLRTILISGDHSTNNDIQQFINQKYLNLSNLQRVFLHNFNNQFPDFSGLLSQFKMIQHLTFWAVIVSRQMIESDKLCQLFPNLTRLSLFGGIRSISNAMINEYGSNLECLSFNASVLNCDNINFCKLRRLLTLNPTLNTINDILKTAKGLKQMAFSPYSPTGSVMSSDEIKAVITKIIFDRLSLEFLYISSKMDSFKVICNAVESTLHKTSKRKREFFEIALDIDCREKFDAVDFMFNISRIINVLNASNTKDFIVGFECIKHGEFDFDVMLKAINDCIQFIPTVKLMKATKLGFIIGNKQCKMKRHNKWWHDCVPIKLYS